MRRQPVIVKIIVTVLFLGLLGLCGWAAQSVFDTIDHSEEKIAKVVSCESKWTTQSSSSPGHTTTSRRQVLVYTPRAVTEDGDFAEGSVWFGKNICKRMIGKHVAVYIHKTEASKNRINTFVQFWFLPSLPFLLLTVSIFGFLFPSFNKFVMLGYIAFAGFKVAHEFGYLDRAMHGRAGLSTEGAYKSSSERALDICVEEYMAKEKIKQRKDLKTLICQDTGITDLSSLSDLENLEGLYLQENQLTSLETIPALKNLKSISVAGNDRLTSIKGIEKLTALEEFQANKAGISDLSGMEVLKNLRVVGLMMNKISDISAFKDLDKLEDVTLNYNTIRDISALANKPNLVDIQVYTNYVSDISPLFGNKNMKIVGVSGKGEIPCDQIAHLRSILAPDAKIWGPKVCDE